LTPFSIGYTLVIRYLRMSLFYMKKIARIAITILVVFAFPLYVFTAQTRAATLTNASVSMTDSRPSQAGVSYTFTFSGVTSANVKCVKIQFSDSVVAGSKPTGMTLGAITVSGTYGASAWTPSITDATGLATFTDVTGATAANGTVILSAAITNGSTKEVPYYARFNSYGNVDCATTPRDDSVVSFIYTDGVTVTATVDPTLTFTVAGLGNGVGVNGATTNVISTATTVPFGTITTSTNKIGGNTLTVATNAANGFTVFTRNTQLLTSGASTILAHIGSNASPSAFPAAGVTEAFGYTTDDTTLSGGTPARFTTPGNYWAGFGTTFTGNEVFYSGTPISSTAVKVGMQLSIVGTTKAGSYTTVVEYSAVPVY